jgi:hypothetical protein
MPIERSEPHRAAPPPSGAPAASHKAPAGLTPKAAAQRPWLIRKRGATDVLRCPDLATVYQWILEKRLVRDDEISRGGRKWRRMSSVVELESLFYSAEQERASRRRTGQHTPVALPTVGEPRVTPTATPTAAPPRAEEPAPAPVAATPAPAPAAAAEKVPEKKDALGPLKVTPPGLASGPAMLPMRLVRNPPGGKKPAMPGMAGSVQAAMKGKPASAAETPAAKPQPAAKAARDVEPLRPARDQRPGVAGDAKDSPSGGQTLLFKRDASKPPAEAGDEDNDETRRIMQQEIDGDETRRIPPDARRGAGRDPVEDALLRNDPVPRSIQEQARGSGPTRLADSRSTEFITDAHPTTGGRRTGVILAVVGVLGLGLWYLMRSPEPSTGQGQGQVSMGQGSTGQGSTGQGSTGQTAAGENTTGQGATPGPDPSGQGSAVTAPKPIVEPVVRPVAEPLPPTPTADAKKPPAPTPASGSKTEPAAPQPGTPTAPPGATPAASGQAAAPAAKPATPPAPAAKPATPTVSPAKPEAPAATASGTPPATSGDAAKPTLTLDELRKYIDGEVPKSFDGQIELANRLFERSKYDQSKMMYEYLLTYASSVPAVHKGLGDIAFERNLGDEALKHYNAALERRPSYSAAVFGLAKTYHLRKNDKDKALQNYTKYLELNPKGAAATLAREAITKLGGTPPATAPAIVP